MTKQSERGTSPKGYWTYRTIQPPSFELRKDDGREESVETVSTEQTRSEGFSDPCRKMAKAGGRVTERLTPILEELGEVSRNPAPSCDEEELLQFTRCVTMTVSDSNFNPDISAIAAVPEMLNGILDKFYEKSKWRGRRKRVILTDGDPTYPADSRSEIPKKDTSESDTGGRTNKSIDEISSTKVDSVSKMYLRWITVFSHRKKFYGTLREDISPSPPQTSGNDKELQLSTRYVAAMSFSVALRKSPVKRLYQGTARETIETLKFPICHHIRNDTTQIFALTLP